MTIGASLHPVMLPLLPIHLATALTTTTSSSGVSLSPSPSPSSASPLIPVAATAGLFVRRAVSPCVDSRGAKETKVRTQVIAAQDLPVNATTTEFPAEDIFKISSDRLDMTVRISTQGELECADADGSYSWIAASQLADDVHSCNVLLQSNHNARQRHQFLLRTIRPLRRGQKLLLWFSEELLVPLNLPFLLPANIQGDKKYVCHLCRRQFEAPNPLKLHLALNCGLQNLRHLWRRLLKSATPSPPLPPTSPPQVLPTSPCGAFRPYANISSSSANTSNGLPKQTKEIQSQDTTSPAVFLSTPAFSSVGFTRLPPDSLALQPLFIRPRMDLSSAMSSLPTTNSNQRHQVAMPSISSYHQHATDMETLVSNLGTSKQGHLCIYCGKVYSRKYGLKIHIRTHTGFKPLRCKYCLRPFGDPSNLNKHVRLHAEGKTPYKCNLCGKVLVRRRDLERHVKSRHGGQDIDEDVVEGDASDSGDIDAEDVCEADDLSKESKEVYTQSAK